MSRAFVIHALCLAGGLLASAAEAQTVESGRALSEQPGSAEQESESPAAEAPRLVVLTNELENGEGLAGMLRAQLPGWRIQVVEEPLTMLEVDQLKGELRPEDAMLWLERGDEVVHVVVSGREGRALSSPIPTDGNLEDGNRVFALATVGLLVDLSDRRQRLEAYENSALRIRNRQLDELRRQREEDARRIERLARSTETLRAEVNQIGTRPNRWVSPIAPDGWSFRMGWAQAFSPLHDGNTTTPRPYAWPTSGLRLSLGHRFAERLTVGGSLVTLHARGLWNGSLSAFASLHSRTRLRVGISAEVGLLVAREDHESSDHEVTWGSVRFYVPFELGVVMNEHGGVSVKCGPTLVKAPNQWFVGYDLSVEWEFD